MHIPFSIVENVRFQTWVNTTTSIGARFLPKDGDTIRNWILLEFKRKQKELVAAFQTSKSFIHFSFDLWTSPNFQSILGIVRHFINAKGKNITTLLGLRRLRGSHSGVNMAEPVIKVI